MTDALTPDRPRGRTRDLATLTPAVVVALWAYFGISAAGALGGLFEQSVLAGIAGGNPAATAQARLSDTIVSAISLIEVLVYLVSGFLTLKWIYRSTLNAKALAPGADITPGWSIGWYFVPFANLVMPFQFMDKVWRISHAPLSWRSAEAPTRLRLWWGLWIVTGISGNLAFRLSMAAHDVGALQAAGVVSLISELCSLPLTWVLISIVKAITVAQAAALRETVFD